jgi:hypothetical protein
MNNNHKPHDYLPVVIIFIFSLLVISIFLVTSFNPFQQGSNSNQTTPIPLPTINPIVEVPFEYVITGITESLITLTGQNGDLILPFDDSIVKVKSQTTSSEFNLSNLIVGQSVNLSFIPGQSAELLVK